jgi:hypothetical protein
VQQDSTVAGSGINQIRKPEMTQVRTIVTQLSADL